MLEVSRHRSLASDSTGGQYEEEIMSTIAHRSANPMGEILDWLDQNAPFRMRGFGIVPYVRVEDFVREGMYVLRAELPGIDPDRDIDLEVNADSLTISGQRQEEKRDRNHHEFHYGSFSRTVPTSPWGQARGCEGFLHRRCAGGPDPDAHRDAANPADPDQPRGRPADQPGELSRGRGVGHRGSGELGSRRRVELGMHLRTQERWNMPHSDPPSMTDVQSLAATRQTGCASIYVPMSLTGHGLGQIQLKTLLPDAVTRLRQSGMVRRQSPSSSMPASGCIGPMVSPCSPGLWTQPRFGSRS